MGYVAMALMRKRVTSPIIGFSSVKRLEEAMKARGKLLSEEEGKYLQELYVDEAVGGHLWGPSQCASALITSPILALSSGEYCQLRYASSLWYKQ